MIITAKTREGIERTIGTNDIFDILEFYSETNPNGREVVSYGFDCEGNKVSYSKDDVKQLSDSKNFIDLLFSFIDEEYKDFSKYSAKYYINDEYDRYVRVSDEGDPKSISIIVEYDERVSRWMLTLNTGGDKPSIISLWLPIGFIREFPEDMYALCDAGVKLFAAIKYYLKDVYDIQVDAYQELPSHDTVLRDKEFMKSALAARARDMAMKKKEEAISAKEIERRKKKRAEERKRRAEEKCAQELKAREEARQLLEEKAELEKRLRRFKNKRIQVKELSTDELRYFIITAKRVAPKIHTGLYRPIEMMRNVYEARQPGYIENMILYGKKFYAEKLLKTKDLSHRKYYMRDAYYAAINRVGIIDLPENYRKFAQECKDVDRIVRKKLSPPKKGNLNHGPDYDVEYTDEELFGDEEGYENEIDEEDLKIPYLGNFKGDIIDVKNLPECVKDDNETVKDYLKNNCYDAILVDCFD